MDRPDSWPTRWIGRWVADTGKSVVITMEGSEFVVSVLPQPDAEPYRSAELLAGGTKAIDRLPARCFMDAENRRYLELEAGTPELGPTYRLYAAVEDRNGRRTAPLRTPAPRVVLVPNSLGGLYDDWEDDLGVPWAGPFEPFRWASKA